MAKDRHFKKRTKYVKVNFTQKKSQKPTTKARVYNLIIVDESGSMGHLRDVTLSGINETIGTIRNAQKEFAKTQEHFLTLVTFDSDYGREDVRTLINREPIEKVADFKDYEPNGCTPLYDAMGMSLTELDKFIGNDEAVSVVVTVLTDGLENASKVWNAVALRALIEKLKEKGWTFSYMGSAHNVKEVTDMLAIDNVMEFAHDVVGARSTWKRERGAKFGLFRKLNEVMMDFYDCDNFSQEEFMANSRSMNEGYYNQRVTPEYIKDLSEDEIFVFGSNSQGSHTEGATAQAVKSFGAEIGKSEGPQGRSYAIPTTSDLNEVKSAVSRFTEFARQHPEKRFLVTAIGCGLAGFKAAQIAPLFCECVGLENVSLLASFWSELGLDLSF